MPKRVVLIHTLPLLINTFSKLVNDLKLDVELVHIVDEVLLQRVRQHGETDHSDLDWLRSVVTRAQDIKAQAVMVTCTILSECVDEVRSEFSIPIIKIDELMMEKAVSLGDRIGMVVTFADTTEPSSQMILDQAERVGKTVTVIPVLVENAFDAVRNGNPGLHDELVKRAVLDLAPQVDVIVLAQASMARVLDVIPEAERLVPILSSPYLAFEQLQNNTR